MENVKKLYRISFFYSLIPAYVIERLFWQERGMTITMAVYCEIIYALVITVCEIPSGILADKFGRKRLLIVNSALGVVEFSILLFADEFWMFAVAVFFAGIGKSLSSGSKNALLYDSLLLDNKQDDFEKELGRISAIEFFGFLLAALSGSMLTNYFDFSFNYMISAGSMCIAFLMTFLLKEPIIKTKQEEQSVENLQYTKQSLSFFKSQPVVFIYCLSGAIISASMIYVDEFWQLLMENIGVTVAFFGIISSFQMVARIPGNVIAYKLKEKIQYRNIFHYIIIINVLAYVAIFFLRSIFCLIPIILLCFVSGVIDPLVFGYLHHHTESHIRATVESFFSLGLRIISVGVGIFFGYISDMYSIYEGFLLLGVICLGYYFIYGKNIKNHR